MRSLNALRGWWFPLACMVFAGMACLLLAPGLTGGFIFDDGPNIVSNAGVHLGVLDVRSLHEVVFGVQPGGMTRVLPTLSFALDYWRGGGLDPAVFKATNLVIHALTFIVLAFFFRRLLAIAGWQQLRLDFAALLMALVWAIHPLQVSSVLYVVQRMQTMGTLFLLLALLSYLKARQEQMAGESGRTTLMLTMLFWVLAMGCKEDSILLPVYMLALEATVLRFRGSDSESSRILKRTYLCATLIGGILYSLVIVPHYWSWDAYSFRDFNSYERLLTQGRVLVMYLGQILVPLPRYMPFYYDWLQPSRGLFQPWSTLPALLLVFSLLIVACRLRERRPLLALGVFIFFGSHAVSSNVAGLELAFEHRNHFALIGVVLVMADVLMVIVHRTGLGRERVMLGCVFLLIGLAVSVVTRASIWGNPFKLAHSSTRFAPESARAWNSLCLGYFNLGGGGKSDNPLLDKAIAACASGATVGAYSITSLTNLVVFKGIKGNLSSRDWAFFFERLQMVPLTPENSSAIWVVINNANRGVNFDDNYLFRMIDIAVRRGSFSSIEYAAIGYFIMGRQGKSEQAYPYFELSVKSAAAGSPLPQELIAELRAQGREDWASQLEKVRNPKR